MSIVIQQVALPDVQKLVRLQDPGLTGVESGHSYGLSGQTVQTKLEQTEPVSPDLGSGLTRRFWQRASTRACHDRTARHCGTALYRRDNRCAQGRPTDSQQPGF